MFHKLVKGYWEFWYGFHSILKCCITKILTAYNSENCRHSEQVFILQTKYEQEYKEWVIEYISEM